MENRRKRPSPGQGPRIAAIGGGTGLGTMLRGLKEYTANLTAIVTVADDGGGSGVLRQELGMLPPGDIRNCMEALANAEPLMRELMHYRFQEGSLAGQSFGNLFLAALNGISPTFDQAVARMSQVLAVTGQVLPVTTADVQLEAELENGAHVVGESKIFYCKKREDCRIRRVRLLPENPPALPAALEAIREADLIVLGPGSLYTSIIPNLLVEVVAREPLHQHHPKPPGGRHRGRHPPGPGIEGLCGQRHDPGGGDGGVHPLRPHPGHVPARRGGRPLRPLPGE